MDGSDVLLADIAEHKVPTRISAACRSKSRAGQAASARNPMHTRSKDPFAEIDNSLQRKSKATLAHPGGCPNSQLPLAFNADYRNRLRPILASVNRCA